MRCRRLALGLGFGLLVGVALCSLWLYVENVPPPVYIPYYLPCPEIFNMKLQYKGVKPFQPVAQSQYPQPKLLEPKHLADTRNARPFQTLDAWSSRPC